MANVYTRNCSRASFATFRKLIATITITLFFTLENKKGISLFDCSTVVIPFPPTHTHGVSSFFPLLYPSNRPNTSQNPQEANSEDAARLFVKLLANVFALVCFLSHESHLPLTPARYTRIHEYHTQRPATIYTAKSRVYQITTLHPPTFDWAVYFMAHFRAVFLHDNARWRWAKVKTRGTLCRVSNIFHFLFLISFLSYRRLETRND